MKGLLRLMVLLTAALALACCRGRSGGGSSPASDSFASLGMTENKAGTTEKKAVRTGKKAGTKGKEAGGDPSFHSEEAGGRRKNLPPGTQDAVIAGLDRQSPGPESFPPGTILSFTDLESAELSDFFSSAPVDSAVFARIDGLSYKEGCPVAVEDLRYLRVLHKDLEGRTLVGEMIANQSIADDLLEIFRALYDAGYPIERMRLIDDYGADDETSMQANNSSCFNFRKKAHINSVSKHAYGEAVDINPLYNPYYRVTAAGARIIEPASGEPYVDRAADFPYKIERGDLCHRLFLEHGFHWGGSWTRSKDYQHFER